MYARNFIMGHSMRLSMFNSFNILKLLALAPTRFSPTIVLLKRTFEKRTSRDGY